MSKRDTLSAQEYRQNYPQGFTQSEDDLQMCCVRLFAVKWPLLYRSKRLHHSPNGGKRQKATAARFKAMGTQPGFPDLLLTVPRGGYGALFMELKSGRNDLTDHQKAFIAEHEGDYRCVVIRSVDEFEKAVNDYLYNETK